MKKRPRTPLPVILCVVCAVLPCLAWLQGVPAGHDLPDHLAMTQGVRDGWLAGSIYPRWISTFNSGWGEPTLVFYPPGLYFVSSLSALAWGGDVVSGLLTSLAVFSLVGAFGVYVLTRPVAGRWGAAFATALFTAVPYRIFELHAASLLSAFAAGCVLPWALVCLWRVATAASREESWRAFLWWSLAYAALALLNLPVAVLLVYLTGAVSIIIYLSNRDWRIPVIVALGGGFGAALAGAYLLPAALELDLIAVPHTDGQELYLSNFLFQGQGSWMSDELWTLFTRMGLLPLGALVASAIVLAAASRGSSKDVPATGSRSETEPPKHILRPWLITCGGFAAGCFFLATPVSKVLWDNLPLLHRVNLPWRLLGVAAAPVAALAGLAVARLWCASRVGAGWRVAMGIAFVAILTLASLLDVSISGMNGYIPRDTLDQRLPNLIQKPGYFLPQGAAAPNKLPRVPRVVALGNSETKIVGWSPAHRRITVRAAVPTVLALRTYGFPGWTATRTAEGRQEPLPTHTEKDTGRLLVEVPAGESDVTVRFESTPTRHAAGICSIIAMAVWVVLAWWCWLGPRRKQRKNLRRHQSARQTAAISA